MNLCCFLGVTQANTSKVNQRSIMKQYQNDYFQWTCYINKKKQKILSTCDNFQAAPETSVLSWHFKQDLECLPSGLDLKILCYCQRSKAPNCLFRSQLSPSLLLFIVSSEPSTKGWTIKQGSLLSLLSHLSLFTDDTSFLEGRQLFISLAVVA